MNRNIKALSAVIFVVATHWNNSVSAQLPGAGTPSSPNIEALNPQPLPPKASQALQPNGKVNALNPQPLPPKERGRSAIAIKSLRETANMSPETMVKIAGRELSVKALREQVAVSKPVVEASSGALFKFSSGDSMSPVNRKPRLNDAASDIRDQLDRYAGGSQGRVGGSKPSDASAPAPAPWVKHELPKSRWKLVSCADTSNERAVVNHCAGNDLNSAKANAHCVSQGLVNRVNGIGVITTVFCNVNGGDHAGGFHTKYNASNFEKKSGVDVYEININSACRWEHWWTGAYNTASVTSSSPASGVVRATASWKTDACISAKATFFGATVDEDYACMTGYYNTKTLAECPAGVLP